MSKDMNLSVNGQSQVPPGFRFHPTEEELLHYYLRKKVAYEKIDLDVIRDVDLNKLEPWDIQEKCRIGSTPQNDWYFFSHKDKKYPTGTRTNRATAAGFWKATGRDKVIHSNCKRIGMRKTLVFYKGRAPHGQKSDWIMHEYRLDDNINPQESVNVNTSESSNQEEGWVVCRVFKKKNYHKALESPQSSSAALSRSTVLVQKPNNDGFLDQILMYMGRSCKQQDLDNKHNNNLLNNINNIHLDDHVIQINNTTSFINTNNTSNRFLHLPALENHHSPTNNMDDVSSLQLIQQDCCSFGEMLTETHEHRDDPKTSSAIEMRWSHTSMGSGPSDWVSLDRLVASQLNGHDHVENITSNVENNNVCFPLHHNGLQLGHLRTNGRPNDDDDSFSQPQPHDGDVEFWSYARSSSSSPSDPLCHLSV